MPQRFIKKRKRRKRRKKLPRFVIVSLLFLTSFGFLGVLAFYKNLTKSFVSADSNTNNSFDIINADLSTLLLVTVEDIKSENFKITSLDMIFFDTKTNKVVSFDIPLDWEVDVPGKYGKESFSNVFAVSMMNSNNSLEGIKLLEKTVEKKFAFNVDRFILTDKKSSSVLRDTFKFGKSRGLLRYDNLVNSIFNIKTNLKLNEFYSLYSFVNGLTPDRFTDHNKSADILENSDYINNILRDLNFDSEVVSESASIAVLNGTNTPGVAKFSAEVIKNFGGHVIEVGNSMADHEESILIVSSLDLKVVEQIVRFFEVKNVVLKKDYKGEDFVLNRADVTLIVGLDKAIKF